jgi:hypothetical protein
MSSILCTHHPRSHSRFLISGSRFDSPRFRPLSLRSGGDSPRVGHLIAIGLTVFVTLATAAEAQQGPINPPPRSPVQIGPIYLTPRFELHEVGVDSNVFNDDREEKDFTATFAAGLEAIVLTGPGRLTTSTTTDYVWYDKFAAERSINNTAVVGFEVFTARLRPWIRAEYTRTRERPGFEIDTRARRKEPILSGGLDLNLGGRTALQFNVRHHTTHFGTDEFYRDVNLSEELDSSSRAYGVAYRMELTPLTTFILKTEIQQDRFEQATARDSRSFMIAPRLELDPDALLAGQIELGFRSFQPDDERLPDYTGLVGSAGVTYTLFQSTQFSLQFERNTTYSYEVDEPYYLRTGGTLSVTQRLVGPFDLQFTVGRQQLAYRASGSSDFDRRASTGSPRPEPVEERLEIAHGRVDRVETLGGGVGYRLGDTVRLGVNVESATRRSTARPDRRYDRTRYFVTASYAL